MTIAQRKKQVDEEIRAQTLEIRERENRWEEMERRCTLLRFQCTYHDILDILLQEGISYQCSDKNNWEVILKRGDRSVIVSVSDRYRNGNPSIIDVLDRVFNGPNTASIIETSQEIEPG